MDKLSDEDVEALWDGDLDGWEEVESSEHNHCRWTYDETKVFKKPNPPACKGMDQYYGVTFCFGATESQENEGVVKHGPMAAIQVTRTEYKWY